MIPWSFKFFYGLIADTFPIFGSRKKSYIILMSIIQVLCCLGIALFNFGSATPLVYLGTGVNLVSAFMDVIVDGMMVQQQRLDPEYGSEELQSLSYAFYGIGGVVGSLFVGYTTQNDCNELTFIALATIGLLIAIVGFTMSMELESGAELRVNMSLKDRIASNFKDILTGFKIREFYRAIIFFVILWGLIPSFADYFYYYLTDYAGISEFEFAMTILLSYFCLFFASLAYNAFFREKNIHFMMVLACLTNVYGAITSFMIVVGWTFGINNFVFVLGSTTITEVLGTVFIQLPSTVVFAKMIPQNIEASLFAIITGLLNFALFASRELGNLINKFVGADEENL